jgi:hypothetical protein
MFPGINEWDGFCNFQNAWDCKCTQSRTLSRSLSDAKENQSYQIDEVTTVEYCDYCGFSFSFVCFFSLCIGICVCSWWWLYIGFWDEPAISGNYWTILLLSKTVCVSDISDNTGFLNFVAFLNRCVLWGEVCELFFLEKIRFRGWLL